MQITSDHWLVDAIRKPIPGGATMSTRRFLVIHHTAGWGAMTSVEFWQTSGTCAHIIIDRDGTIIQCRPFNRTAAHAGASSWKDPNTGITYNGLNTCAIGIELANCGTLARETYPSTCGPQFSGRKIPRLIAAHKHGGKQLAWEQYTDAQLDACEHLSKALVKRYNLDDLIGHEDISPGRKVDPGPAYPMQALRQACGFIGLPKR